MSSSAYFLSCLQTAHVALELSWLFAWGGHFRAPLFLGAGLKAPTAALCSCGIVIVTLLFTCILLSIFFHFLCNPHLTQSLRNKVWKPLSGVFPKRFCSNTSLYMVSKWSLRKGSSWSSELRKHCLRGSSSPIFMGLCNAQDSESPIINSQVNLTTGPFFT